jgi:hypothetical protein
MTIRDHGFGQDGAWLGGTGKVVMPTLAEYKQAWYLQRTVLHFSDGVLEEVECDSHLADAGGCTLTLLVASDIRKDQGEQTANVSLVRWEGGLLAWARVRTGTTPQSDTVLMSHTGKRVGP